MRRMLVPRALVSVLAAGALAGCAVLEINVDVYKGPLANHDDVQTEQFAAMAIGARPLLDRLHQSLASKLKDLASETTDTGSPPPEGQRNYRSDEEKREEIKKVKKFVEDVQGLYEDDENLRVAELLERANAQVPLAERRWAVLDDVGGVMSTRLQGAPFHLRRALDAAAKNAKDPKVRDLALAYAAFLFPGRPGAHRDWRGVLGAVDALISAPGYGTRALGIDALPGGGLPSYCRFDDGKSPPCTSASNEGYRALHNREMLRAHARLLFGADGGDSPTSRAVDPAPPPPPVGAIPVPDSPEPPGDRPDGDPADSAARSRSTSTEGHFVNAVADVAKSFSDTRGAIEELLQLALQGLAISDTLVLNPADDEQCVALVGATPEEISARLLQAERDRAAAESCGPSAGQARAKLRLVRTVAGFAADLIQPQYLVLALQNEVYASPVIVGWFRGAFRDTLGTERYHALVAGGFDTDRDYQDVRDITESLLVRYPVEAAQALLAVHAAARSGVTIPRTIGGVTVEERIRVVFGQVARWFYGIGSGPGGDRFDLPAFRRFVLDFQAGTRDGGLFDRGRLAEGLLTLIEGYVRAAKAETLGRATVGVPAVADAEGRCPDPDKCGHAALLDEKNRRRDLLLGALVRFAEKVLFVVDNETLVDLGVDKSDHVLVLQAIGNSIEVHADHIRHRETHARKLAEGAAAEAEALAGATQTSVSERVGEDARDVLDRLIATLRHDHIDLVRKHGRDDSRAEHAEEALAVAYEQRAGMAFIRPSIAYLRSSYPATALQDDANLGWRNLLQEHSLRTMPFVGQSLANAADKDRLRIQGQIDKQFWQNVNSVRFAGSGRFNYVAAKDDIGNWYVKAFQTERKDIFESMSRLALFGAGGGFDQNLLARLDQANEEGDLPPPQPGQQPGGGAALSRGLETYERDFATGTLDDIQELNGRLEDGGVPSAIRDAWADNANTAPIIDLLRDRPAELQSVLDAARSRLAETDSEAGIRLLAALQGLRRYHNRLLQRVRAITPEDADTTAGDADFPPRLEAAAAEVTSVVRAEIQRFVDRHRRRLGTYESAVVFVSRARAR